MDKNQNQSNQQHDGEGRSSNINQPHANNKTNSDISNDDMQEGKMNHGEIGGDLKIKSDGELETDE